MDLSPELTTVVHPINVDEHPSEPPGWRWAVMIGGCPAHMLEACANAGWAPTRGQANLDGDSACVAAVWACRKLAGLPVAFKRLELDHDPRKPFDDRVNVLSEA